MYPSNVYTGLAGFVIVYYIRVTLAGSVWCHVSYTVIMEFSNNSTLCIDQEWEDTDNLSIIRQ